MNNTYDLDAQVEVDFTASIEDGPFGRKTYATNPFACTLRIAGKEFDLFSPQFSRAALRTAILDTLDAAMSDDAAAELGE
jgi:hypothetical protein